MKNVLLIEDIARHIDAEIREPTSINRKIMGFSTLKSADKGHLCFMLNGKHLTDLKTTKASAVILQEEYASMCPSTALVVDDPYVAFAKATQLFSHRPPVRGQNIHKNSTVDETVKLPKNITLEAGAIIHSDVHIDEYTHIASNAVISEGSVIGRHCYIDCNVSILRDTRIGNHCIIGPGSVIGSEGFGNAWDKKTGRWHTIVHQGKVVIEDYVEIGANNTIDRGTIDDTIIAKGVRLDNLIMIAHNCHIGEHTALAGQVGLAGHVRLGSRVRAGGQVGFSGHIEISDDAVIMGKAMVAGSIKKPGVYGGYPAKEFSSWKKEIVQLSRITRKK